MRIWMPTTGGRLGFHPERLLRFPGDLLRLGRIRRDTCAAVHCIPVIFPELFFLGVVQALVLERTRSVYCCMILHALQNTLAVIAFMTT